MMHLPCVGDIWEHFKGNRYIILGYEWRVETDVAVLSIRYAKEGDAVGMPEFSRPVANFMVRDNLTPRFRLIEKDYSRKYTCPSCAATMKNFKTVYCVRCARENW